MRSGLSCLCHVCLLNTHQTPPLPQAQAGRVHQPSASRHTGGAPRAGGWRVLGLRADCLCHLRQVSCLCLTSAAGSGRVGLRGHPAPLPAEVTDFTAVSWLGGQPSASSREVTLFAFLLGSVTQEGGRPCGSLIWDATQQPGRLCIDTRPLPTRPVSVISRPAWVQRGLSGHNC